MHPADSVINILNDPPWRHPTPITPFRDFLFFDSSEGQTQFRSQPGIILCKQATEYAYNGELLQLRISATPPTLCRQNSIRTLFLAIMWTKKFMNTRDEYRMIRLSLAVIVLEFPSWSDPPLPPSPHPNSIQSPHPHCSATFFLFVPGI